MELLVCSDVLESSTEEPSSFYDFELDAVFFSSVGMSSMDLVKDEDV